MKKEYINQIEQFLRSEGFEDKDLIHDLQDHLASEIEHLMEEGINFEDSFEKAKSKLLPETPYQIERDLKLLTTQKHNIMIKKIAYIGGYLSAVSLAVAILFGILSYQERIDSNSYRILVDTQNQSEFLIGENYDEEWKDYISEMEISQLDVIRKSKLFQSFLVASILILSFTYLPYRFYDGYQKSNLEIA